MSNPLDIRAQAKALNDLVRVMAAVNTNLTEIARMMKADRESPNRCLPGQCEYETTRSSKESGIYGSGVTNRCVAEGCYGKACGIKKPCDEKLNIPSNVENG